MVDWGNELLAAHAQSLKEADPGVITDLAGDTWHRRRCRHDFFLFFWDVNLTTVTSSGETAPRSTLLVA